MALKIRLTRTGAKKRPSYRIVVADARGPRDGGFLERVGHYHPLLAKDNPERVQFDQERVRHWLERGAQPTDRVARFLGLAGLIPMPQRNNPQKAEPGTKAKERAEARAAAAAAPPAAPAAPEASAPAASEAPEAGVGVEGTA